jgi:hypothetical protein
LERSFTLNGLQMSVPALKSDPSALCKSQARAHPLQSSGQGGNAP